MASPPARPESVQKALYPHDSHSAATELLIVSKKALGAAYGTLHLLARWSLEHASERDPAPHLMTTYWSLAEALGKSERTLQRHLVESGHPWSEAVQQFIDVRACFGPYLCGRGEDGRDLERPAVVATIIRFFPRGRCSANARVKRYGRRDLLNDSDEGRTAPGRDVTKSRYERVPPRMSVYSSVKEQCQENNWFMVKLGQTITDRQNQPKDSGNLYADIPKNHVLDALRADLDLALERASLRGSSLKRTRTVWVDAAAQVLAQRFNDDRPQPRHLSDHHTTHWDGFTNLWRRALWTAIKAELYGGTALGWTLLQQVIVRAGEGAALELNNPVAWAYAGVRDELDTLRRDYGSGMAGVVVKGPPSRLLRA